MIAGGVNYSYDPLGNLTAKTDYADSYTYNQFFGATQVGGCINDGRGFRTTMPGPHATTQITTIDTRSSSGTISSGQPPQTHQLAYGKNGNLLCFGDGALNLWYDPYNLPAKIQRFNQMQEFRYGPDLQRYLQVAGGVTTVYLERSYEKEISTDKVRFKIAEDVLIRMETNQNPVIDYQHRDRLGSIVAVTNEFKAIEGGTERGFGPFGKPRDANWNDQNILPGANITPRGFTDHEHLNGSRLIHMNGRFLSVDPVIQFPANSQSLNPYSYIMNNPLSGTDPTGYVACDPDGSGCDLTNLSLSEVDSISVGNQGQVIVTTTGGESFQVNGVTSAGGQSLPPQSFLAGAINILGNNGGDSARSGGSVQQSGNPNPGKPPDGIGSSKDRPNKSPEDKSGDATKEGFF